MRENFHKLVENKLFAEKSFTHCSLVPLKDATQNLSHKTSKLAKVFSLESFHGNVTS